MATTAAVPQSASGIPPAPPVQRADKAPLDTLPSPAPSGELNGSQRSVMPILERSAPVIKALLNLVDALSPVVNSGFTLAGKLWEAAEPYHPEEFTPVALGLVMVFCGGYYPMLIAAVEAFRTCGWDRTHKSLVKMWESFKIAKAASERDDLVDENKDGIADVKQITAKQLVSRKIGVVLQAVDPAKVNSAIMGISAGCFAVVATLRVQFAMTVTLGAALGDIAASAFRRFLTAPLTHVVPPEYTKWIPVGLTWIARMIGVSIAYFIQRVISAAHSAMRGAQMIVTGLTSWLDRRGYTTTLVEEGSIAFTSATLLIAIFGFWVQLKTGFGLVIPFPLSILTWPLTFLEWLVGWAVYLAD